MAEPVGVHRLSAHRSYATAEPAAVALERRCSRPAARHPGPELSRLLRGGLGLGQLGTLSTGGRE